MRLGGTLIVEDEHWNTAVAESVKVGIQGRQTCLGIIFTCSMRPQYCCFRITRFLVR